MTKIVTDLQSTSRTVVCNLLRMIPAENQKAADYGKGGCGVCPEKSEKTCKEVCFYQLNKNLNFLPLLHLINNSVKMLERENLHEIFSVRRKHVQIQCC